MGTAVFRTAAPLGAPNLEGLSDAQLLRLAVRQVTTFESGVSPAESCTRRARREESPIPAPSLEAAIKAAHGLGPVVVTTTRENNGVLDPPDLATAIRQQGRSA